MPQADNATAGFETLEVPGKGPNGGSAFLDFPAGTDPAELEEAVFAKWPDLAPKGSAVKSGVAQGLLAFVETGENLIGRVLDLPGMEVLEGETGVSAKEAKEQRLLRFHANIKGRMKAPLEEFIEKETPRSFVGQVTSGAIGLAVETPLFLAGGGPVAKMLPKAVSRIQKAFQGAATTGAAFGGEAALRGRSAEDVAGAAVTGAAVGTAGKVLPIGTKTVGEALALLGAEKLVHGKDELTAGDYATVLATLIELKILGKVLRTSADLPKAVRIARAKRQITPEQAEKAAEVLSDPDAQVIVNDLLARAEAVRAEHPKDIKKIIDLTIKKARVVDTKPEVAKVKPIMEAAIRLEVRTLEDTKARRDELPPGQKAKLDEIVKLESRAQKFRTGESKAGAKMAERMDARVERLTEQIVRDFNVESGKERPLADLSRPEIVDQILERVKTDVGPELKARAELIQNGAELRQQDVREMDLQRAAKELGYRDIKLPEERVSVSRRDQRAPTLPEGIPSQATGIKTRPTIEQLDAQIQFRSNPVNFEDTPGNKASIERLEKVRDELIAAGEPASGLPRREGGAIDPGLLLPEFIRRGADKLGASVRDAVAGMKVLGQYRGRPEDFQRDVEDVTRYNAFYRQTLTMLQFADINPSVPGFTSGSARIAEGQAYLPLVRRWAASKTEPAQKHDTRLREWHSLGRDQSKLLGRVLVEETRRGTEMSMRELADRGLTEEAVKAKRLINEDFKSFLIDLKDGLVVHAREALPEGAKLSSELKRISRDIDVLGQKPFFPLTRFGNWTVKVVDNKGTTVDFETFTTRIPSIDGEGQLLGAARLASKYRNELGSSKKGWKLTKGIISDETSPFRGMPRLLIDRMTATMNLNKSQRDTLRDLSYELAPERSFTKHLLTRKGIEGFSDDAPRAYASYFFHGAQHVARLRFGSRMDRAIKEVEQSAKDLEKLGVDNFRRNQLVDHLRRHNEYIMNPKNDLASLRALGFIWYLGFLPKAAFINFTQVPLVSFPFLAARYGDVEAGKVLGTAMRDVSFVMRGKRFTQEETDMLDRAMREGTTNQSFAAELAAVSSGRALTKLLPGSKVTRSVRDVAGKGAYLFSMAEGYNRRATFLATYRLERAVGTEPEVAFERARDSVDKTQFEYASWNRPELFRGKKSVFFLFMSFIQNSMYFAARDPGNKRFLGILLAAAGLQGLPGMELVLNSVDRLFSTKNKKFDSKAEMRGFFESMSLDPDLMMHGGSRFGLGVPWLARQAGIPMPDVDFSASLSFGRMIPGTDLLAVGPSDFNRQVTESVKDLGGAFVSMPLGVWQALADDNPKTLKAVEKGMPSFARSISKAFRYLRDGEETTGSTPGTQLAEFDMNRPEDEAAVLFQALGFTPTKVSQAQGKRRFSMDTLLFYQGRRLELLTELAHIVDIGGDTKALAEWNDELRQYNREVPFNSLRLSRASAQQSLRGRQVRKLQQEAGLPKGRRSRDVGREADRLFPQGQ